MPYDAAHIRETLTGILPPLAMPFDAKGDIVYSAIAPQVELMIKAGVRGIVVGGSTGEGHTLARDEFARAMEEAYTAAAGRVPFVAGLIVNSTREALERVKLISHLDIAALQVTPVHYLFKPDADATIRHFRILTEETGLPVLIYNVIPWNYLSVELMLRIMEEVPGVVGMKQSSGDLKSVSDLLGAVAGKKLVLTGIDALIYPAFALGANGSISALNTAVPSLCVRMWNLVRQGDHASAKVLHFQLNMLWNAFNHDNLPACVKYVQHLQGLEMFEPRAPMPSVSAAQKLAIDAAFAQLPL